MKQSQTNQRSRTPIFGVASAIERDNISLHVPRDMTSCGEVSQHSIEEKDNPAIKS